MGYYPGKLLSYKDTEISILASPDDIQVLLEDHIVKTTTMKGSPFIGPFEEEVNQWDITLVSCFLQCFYVVSMYHLFEPSLESSYILDNSSKQ